MDKSEGLVAFLNARLDEDEAAANEIHRPRDCGSVDRDGEFDPDPIWCGCHYPARVLREVAAKRKILALHDCAAAELSDSPGDPKVSGWARAAEVTACDIAAVYSDHPDYRQEWTP